MAKRKRKGQKRVSQKKKTSRIFKKILKGIFQLLKITCIALFKVLWTISSFIVTKTYQGAKFIIQKIQLRRNRSRAVDRKTEKNTKPRNAITLIESVNGNLYSFKQMLFSNQSTIGLILGARGQGKSALGMCILELFHKKRPLYAMGFDKKALPRYITVFEDISEIEKGAFVLIDEGGILFNARDSMSSSNKLLSSLLLIARHKDLSIVFIAQNSSNLELNIIRQADYMLLKPSSLLQIDFERKKIKDIYSEVKKRFAFHKEKVGLTYIYSEPFKGFVSNTLPSFWSEDVSKSFKEK